MRVQDLIERCRAGEGFLKRFPGRGQSPIIELNLGDERLNFWFPFEPIETMYHTHSQGFTSSVLHGEMTNERVTLRTDATGPYRLYTMRLSDRGRTQKLEPLAQRIEISRRTVDKFGPGESYIMDPRDYHASQVDVPTITHVKLWPRQAESYSMLLPLDMEPSTQDRSVRPEDLPTLWEQINELSKSAGII